MASLEKKIKIERNVKVPGKEKGRWSPILKRMRIGDSIVVNYRELCGVQSAALYWSMKTIYRTEGDQQYRIWRVK